jgi:hypothetical protein
MTEGRAERASKKENQVRSKNGAAREVATWAVTQVRAGLALAGASVGTRVTKAEGAPEARR